MIPPIVLLIFALTMLWWLDLGWLTGAYKGTLSLLLLSRTEGEKIRRKRSQVEVRTGRLLTIYYYGQNTQNHRMVEVGRDLYRSSGPNPLLKQGHLKPVAQDHVQMIFHCL